MTLKFNDDVVDEISRSREVERELLEDGWRVAQIAASLAPVANAPGGGAGARSIRAELFRLPAGPEVRVSWDKRHFYMGFQEFGTEHHSAQPFLRPAAVRFRR
jgi:HK97 gp10 family phage protein